jgi:isoleucyl-tRNA synthetase
MSTKFTEYKGLDLPNVASEVLDFWKKNNVFEQSVTSREGATLLMCFLKAHHQQMDCLEFTT